MVPYIRKSFVKHYRDGLKWVYECNDETIENMIYDGNVSIESSVYKQNKRPYEYAIEMTEKEVH